MGMNEPLTAEELSGVYVPVITPMLTDGYPRNRIDYPKLEMLLDELISARVDGIVPCATTGQDCTLGHEEHVQLAVHVFSYVAGRTRVIPSAGSNCTWESNELMNAIEAAIGPSTFLHVTGYKNNPPQTGLIEHFEYLADTMCSAGSNLIMYNVPSRTGSNMLPKTTIRLAQHPRIIGTKEASGNLEQVRAIIEGTDPDSFRVVSGEDNIVADIVEMGGYGVISASANIAPLPFIRIVYAGLVGDHPIAQQLQEHINPLVGAVFSVKNPIPLAYMFATEVRPPLVGVTKEQGAEIDRILLGYTDGELGIRREHYCHLNEARIGDPGRLGLTR